VEYRFQVVVNGEVRCIAGFDGPGTLMACVSTAPRSAGPFFHVIGVNELGVSVWAGDDLTPGDCVAFTLLGPGPIDPPGRIHRHSDPQGELPEA